MTFQVNFANKQAVVPILPPVLNQYTQVVHPDENSGVAIWSCNDCGAYGSDTSAIQHHATCVPGESDKWGEHYANEGKTSAPKRQPFRVRIHSVLQQELERDAVKQNNQQQPAPLLPDTQPVLITPRIETFTAGEYRTLKGDLLDEDQVAAVTGAIRQKYCCIVGQAGVGKTTVENVLIEELEKTLPLFNKAELEPPPTDEDLLYGGYEPKEDEFHIAACFCAFTGRAVQQMKRSISDRHKSLCDTIHGTLAYKPVYEERWDDVAKKPKTVRIFRPTFTANNKLPYKICIVDEAGTCPVFLFNQLIAALPDDCRIFLIGDINQLPPVSGRSILGYAMLKWPTYGLTKLHRNAGPIAINADRILKGRLPQTDADGGVFIFDDIDGSQMKAYRQAIGFVQQLHKAKKFNELEDGFIVPTNVGQLGQTQLNEALVRYFNKPETVDGVITNQRTVVTAGWQHYMYAVGDKIMLLKNIRPLGLTNGMMGVIKSIKLNHAYQGETVGEKGTVSEAGVEDFVNMDMNALTEAFNNTNTDEDEEQPGERQASHVMEVEFQDTPAGGSAIVFSTAGEYAALAHAYCFTCHKSQGSEFPAVIVLIHSAGQYRRMLCREWLYTAFTRARSKVYLLANRRALVHAVNQQRIKGNSWQEKAKSFIQFMESSSNGKNGKNGNGEYLMPNLPEPVEYNFDANK